MLFFDNLASAKSDRENILKQAQGVDQVNVVIRAEAPMDDPELMLPNVKVFAGAAWTLIHERRKTDGWYEEPR